LKNQGGRKRPFTYRDRRWQLYVIFNPGGARSIVSPIRAVSRKQAEFKAARLRGFAMGSYARPLKEVEEEEQRRKKKALLMKEREKGGQLTLF